MTHEVRPFIDHEAATLHLDGVAAAEVRVKVCAVITALITPTLEVLVLIKDNLIKIKVKNIMSGNSAHLSINLISALPQK